MSVLNQVFSLVKQELRSASRSRYIVVSFVLMPALMWGIQGGVQLLVGFSLETSQAGQTIYVVNYDEGNVSDNMGEMFLISLEASTQINGSLLQGAIINSTRYKSYSYNDLMTIIHDPKRASTATPLIIIPSNFTAVYNAYNLENNSISPNIELYSLPGGLIGSSILEAAIGMIASSPPFTVVNIDKVTTIKKESITFPGEEGAANSFGAGFIGFLSVIIAVMAPSPFVSTSFAGEREKKTMESLLALPISRFNILLGKVLAGMVLLTIFAVMNLFGLLGFSWLMSSQVADNDIGTSAMFSIDLSIWLLFLVAITMFLSAFVSIGIGISVASLTKDVRSAESLYTLTMLVPSMAVGIIGMFGALPENAFGGAGIILYIIPWAHSLALLSKGLYPQTYASSTLTGSIPTDILLHVGYIALVIIVCLFVASKVFERENILT